MLTVLHFTRSPAVFHERLQHDEQLSGMRSALSAARLDLRLETGTYMFVPPGVYEAFLAQMAPGSLLHLRSSHVVTTEGELERRVTEAVRSLPRKLKVSVKSKNTMELQIPAAADLE